MTSSSNGRPATTTDAGIPVASQEHSLDRSVLTAPSCSRIFT